MEISKTSYEKSDVIKVSGRIDAAAAPELEAAFKALTDAKRYGIVFDMSEVEFLSSAGVRAMISAQNTCKGKGGELVLALVPPLIMDTLKLAGLQVIFNIYDTIVEAVGSV